MSRLEADEEKIKQELNQHWEVVSEGAQTILRAAGHSDAYESLKSADARTRVRREQLSTLGQRHWMSMRKRGHACWGCRLSHISVGIN